MQSKLINTCVSCPLTHFNFVMLSFLPVVNDSAIQTKVFKLKTAVLPFPMSRINRTFQYFIFLFLLNLLHCFKLLNIGSTIRGNLFTYREIKKPIQNRSNLIYLIISLSTIFNIPTINYNSYAANAVEQVDFNDLTRLKRGLREIDYLLSHWNEKTLYCNFGEFQRELLQNKNKGKLLVAAAETGLLDYDKSATMNVVCKKDPEVVRGKVINLLMLIFLNNSFPRFDF